MRSELPDSQKRQAALDTTRSHHVEAPAGSGKTLLLTMRFLKLLGEVHHPGEIIALTSALFPLIFSAATLSEYICSV